MTTDDRADTISVYSQSVLAIRGESERLRSQRARAGQQLGRRVDREGLADVSYGPGRSFVDFPQPAVTLDDPFKGRFKRTQRGFPAESFDTMFTWLRSQHHLGDDLLYEHQHVRTMHTRDVQIVHLTTDGVTCSPTNTE